MTFGMTVAMFITSAAATRRHASTPADRAAGRTGRPVRDIQRRDGPARILPVIPQPRSDDAAPRRDCIVMQHAGCGAAGQLRESRAVR